LIKSPWVVTVKGIIKIRLRRSCFLGQRTEASKNHIASFYRLFRNLLPKKPGYPSPKKGDEALASSAIHLPGFGQEGRGDEAG
jgi:hypothetical protein